MLSLAVALLLSAEPVVVVAPFDVSGPDVNLGRALASLIEADLKAAGIPVRTEDQLDAKNWGQIKTATHVVTGMVMKLGATVTIAARVISTADNNLLAATKLRSWNARKDLTLAVLALLKKPVPASLVQLQVDDALMTAWGDALGAIHAGDPAAAKQKVADVVKRWPEFTPAKERLAQL